MKAIMNLHEKKLELVQLLLNTEKPSVLKKVEAVLLSEKDMDWWDGISQAEKKAIERGIAEADSGKLTPHSAVMEEIRARYKLDK
jgi:hypothetical protein